MRHIALASFGMVVAAGAWLACSSSDNPPATTTPGVDSGGGGGDSASGGPFALAVPCTDSIDSIYGDPGPLPADKGAIIKCALDTSLSKSDLQAKLDANVTTDQPPAQNLGYQGKPVTSGARVYRILYRTERGDTASTAGYSSAKVFIPDTPRATGAPPLIVGARGSRGQAAHCVASKEDPAASFVNGDYEALAFPIVGAGMPIIVPDLAGYANYGAPNNPVSGYAQYQDVGKGTLDGLRALSKMFPGSFNGKAAIIGHSQGGHSALASLAIQPTYAPEISIAAVAAYSPLWFSQRSWGALVFEPNQFSLAINPSADAVTVWYHYTHGELLDGPGHGLDVFAPAKKTAIKAFIDNDCWDMGFDGSDAGTEYPELQAVATTVIDLFDPSFVTSIKNAAALGQPCKTGDDVCAKWIARYIEDRPHLTNTPPILIEYGSQDQTLPPGRMACVVDRLKNQDHVPFQFCLQDGIGHTGVVRKTASYVADWIASQTMGEPAPAACTSTEVNLVDDAGVAIPCATPPSND